MENKNYLIISNKRKYEDKVVYWKEDFCDYTEDIKLAGMYDLGNIMSMYDYELFQEGDNLKDYLEYSNFIIHKDDLHLIVADDNTYILGGE